MVKVLVDYSNGHEEELSLLETLINKTYEGFPILFCLSWDNHALPHPNTGSPEPLHIDFEYMGNWHTFYMTESLAYPVDFFILKAWFYVARRINEVKLEIEVSLDFYDALQYPALCAYFGKEVWYPCHEFTAT